MIVTLHPAFNSQCCKCTIIEELMVLVPMPMKYQCVFMALAVLQMQSKLSV